MPAAKSRLVEIADAVVAQLRADVAAFIVPFEPQRIPDPVVGLEDAEQVRVDILPRKRRTELLNREGDLQVDYEVDIGVRKKLAGSIEQQPGPNQHDQDILVCLVEQLGDHFFSVELPGVDESLISSDTDSNGVADWWKEHIQTAGIFLSVVTLSFRGFKAAV